MPLLSVKCPSTTEPLCLAACCCFPLRFFLRGPEIAGRCPVFYPVRCCEGRTRGWDRGGCSSPGHCRCGSRRWQQRSGSGRGSPCPRGSEPRFFGTPGAATALLHPAVLRIAPAVAVPQQKSAAPEGSLRVCGL